MEERIMAAIKEGNQSKAQSLLQEFWKSGTITFGYAAWMQDKINRMEA